MIAPLWMPGATAVPSTHDAGSMLGSDFYVTWHTFEAGYSLTAVNAAKRLISAGNEVHLTFNPVLGGVAQILPANRAGRGLVNQSGGVQTNRQGAVNIQIEVIAYSKNPWTADISGAGRSDLRKILAWLDALGIPRRYPNGNQGPLSGSGPFNRSVTGWNSGGGHFCHGQVPENVHWDHGPIRFTDIWALGAPIQEEEMSAAEVQEIKDYVRALLVDKYTVSGVDHAGIGRVVEENQRRITAVTEDLADITLTLAELKTAVDAIAPGTGGASVTEIADELSKRLQA